MTRRERSPIEDLRRTIDCLPLRTRMAMLEGIRTNEIIVGAYTDRAGGVCPMLAAHRCGGRTSFVSFARAWDRFTAAKRPRQATERELRVLVAHLEASILDEERASDLARAIADHRGLLGRARARRWTRPSTRLDDHEIAVQLLEAERAEEELVRG